MSNEKSIVDLDIVFNDLSIKLDELEIEFNSYDVEKFNALCDEAIEIIKTIEDEESSEQL